MSGNASQGVPGKRPPVCHSRLVSAVSVVGIGESHIKVSEVKASDQAELPLNDLSKYYKITFTDNGIGFDSQYSKKIFLLFNRLHNKDEYSGTGIGLAICKKIMDNHKGFIFAEGKQNVGAKFTIYLPLS